MEKWQENVYELSLFIWKFNNSLAHIAYAAMKIKPKLQEEKSQVYKTAEMPKSEAKEIFQGQVEKIANGLENIIKDQKEYIGQLEELQKQIKLFKEYDKIFGSEYLDIC